MVIHGQRGCCRIHNAETLIEHVHGSGGRTSWHPSLTAGSESYTPSTFFASRITSMISAARRTAAVSVEKNGQLRLPQPKITTRPFSRMGRAERMYGSVRSCSISIAVCVRTSTPRCSSASCRASALMVVASMPMRSARCAPSCRRRPLRRARSCRRRQQCRSHDPLRCILITSYTGR